jgi:hypothetical protein
LPMVAEDPGHFDTSHDRRCAQRLMLGARSIEAGTPILGSES